MTKPKKLTARHCAGGTDVGTGVFNIKPEQNIEARNMEYGINGEAITSLGYDDVGMDWGENGSKIDGLHKVENYPNLVFSAVNGKIKYADFTAAPQSSASVYNVDTALSLTAGNPVFMKSYRGMIYYCNGVEPLGRVAIGQVRTTFSAAATPIVMNYAEGYKFTNGADKVYCEGDEIDYTGVSTDNLTGVTNNLGHSAGAYVTQHNTVSSGQKGTTIAIFRDTMFVGGITDEPGVLRYGKTVDTVGNINNLHDFSDGNNYIIGDGGAITALQSTETRLYVFLKDKVHFIQTVFDTSGNQVFDVSRLFTGVYGCPNPYCVVEMEDVVLFFTGKRLIRIGYDPNGQILIPDENFDREIFPLLQQADEDQTNARLVYNPATKELRLKYIVNGIAKVIKYHKQLDKFSAFADEDASCYLVHRKNTYFGDIGNDIVWKIGKSIDSEGDNTAHRYHTGRIDGGTKNLKLFKRGRVSGKKNVGSSVYVLTKIDGKNFGAARLIPESCMDLSAAATPLGEAVIGGDEIGLSGDANNLFPYTYKFLLGRRGKDYSFAISSDESGAIWSIDGYDVEWEESDSEPRTNY